MGVLRQAGLLHCLICPLLPVQQERPPAIPCGMLTFLLAFRVPQVASCNLQDFYNLVDVYLDAVFHPKCVGLCVAFFVPGRGVGSLQPSGRACMHAVWSPFRQHLTSLRIAAACRQVRGGPTHLCPGGLALRAG